MNSVYCVVETILFSFKNISRDNDILKIQIQQFNQGVNDSVGDKLNFVLFFPIKREIESNHCIISHLTFYLMKLFGSFFFSLLLEKKAERGTFIQQSTTEIIVTTRETLKIKRQQRQTQNSLETF